MTTPDADGASRWLDGDDAVLAVEAGDDAGRLRLGRALKDRTYAVLYADRARGARGIDGLRRLAAAAAGAPTRSELLALTDWLEGADAALRGEAARAVAALDRAYDALRALDQAPAAAATQVPKLIALSLLGRHDEALACGERTRAELVAAGDELSAGRVEINLGSMLLRRGRPADAAGHYRRAAVRFARRGDTRHSVMADIGLAGALGWHAEFDEAARIYERALARVRAHGLAGLAGIIDAGRGRLELLRGRHALALRWLEAALAEFERTGPPHALAEARRDLADAYLALNLLPEAVALYDRAIEACRAQGAAIEQGWATTQRARALARLGRRDEAAAALDEARALFDAQGNRAASARAASHAALLAMEGEDAAAALALAASAAAVLSGAGLVGWACEAECLAAEALAAQGRLGAAAPQFEQVASDPGATPEVQAQALFGLARVALARDDRLAARLRLEAAAAVIEVQRAALPGDEFRTAYGSDKQDAFDALVDLALGEQGAGADARLFASLERARARALQATLEQPDAAPPPAGAAGPASSGAEEASRTQLHFLQQQQQQARALGDAARAAQLGVRLRELEAAVQESRRRADVARTQAPPPASPGLVVATLQAELAPDEALVAYGATASALVAVVVRSDRLVRVPIAGAERGDIVQRIEQLRFQIDALRFGARALAVHARQMRERARVHLQALHARLWAPLAPALEGVRHAVVLPHGALHYVPFAALHDGEAALLDRLVLSAAPSAALWLRQRRAPVRPPQQVLALGVGGVGGSVLPHAVAEAAAVARAFDAAGGRGAALLDQAATWPALREALADPAAADVLHLACHGQFRADSPWFSALQLGDGPLTLREAAGLPLAGRTVVLSACETGLSRIAPGDELVGLVRGFLVAGAPTVLSTLWTVDDATTEALMRAFYARLLAGRPAREALREAQVLLRDEHPHPYHWAPFVLHGRG